MKSSPDKLMHEFSLTDSIVEQLKTSLIPEGNCKVIEVTLGFGPFSHGTFDRIQFWWEILTKDTILEGSKLIYKALEGELYCPSCDEVISVKEGDSFQKDEFFEIFSCPTCHSLQTEIKSGTEIIIIDVQIITNQLIEQ